MQIGTSSSLSASCSGEARAGAMRDLAGCGLANPEALLKGDSLMRRTFP